MAFIDWRKKQNWIPIYYAKLKEMNEKQCYTLELFQSFDFCKRKFITLV